MSTKTLAAAAATGALLAAVAAAPAHAAPAKPEPAHAFGLLAWYNDSGNWGYLVNANPYTCHALNPDLKEGAAVGNFTKYKAVFYKRGNCKGPRAFTVGPYNGFDGSDMDARSVKLVPQVGIPEPPDPRK